MSLKNILYISDFFVNEYRGGAELSDDAVINYLEKSGFNVKCINSVNFDPDIDKADTYIISNFTGLSEDKKNYLKENKYIIIERDQKYVKSRNTAEYLNFIAPQTEVINKDFYRNAKKVFCLTNHQADLFLKHINLPNVFVLGCTQFSRKHMEILRKNLNNKKNNRYAVIDGKRKDKAIALCQREGFKYDIIERMSYDELITTLSGYKGLIFFSHAVESCCRLLIEARVLGLKIVTDDRNGCTYESWFKAKKGEDLLNFLEIKVDRVLKEIRENL